MKRFTYCILFLLLWSMASLTAQAQGYSIKVKIKNLNKGQVFLAYHFSDKIYVADTCELNEKGEGIFQKKKTLTGGMYLIFLPTKTYFDIIVGDQQKFSVENDTTNFIKNIKVTGSPENDVFIKYQVFLEAKQKEATDLKKQKDAAKGNAAEEANIQKKLETLDKEVKAEINRIITTYPNYFFAKFLKSIQPIEPPEAPKDAKGQPIDPNFQYNYYRTHYWDNIDLGDPRMLRTPLLEQKLTTYIEKVVYQIPDSLSKEVDILVNKSKKDKECFRFVLGTLYNYFNKSQIMGFDAVFVHVAQYYLNGEADWDDPKYIEELKTKVKKIEPNLLGKIAQNFTVPTVDLKSYIELHKIPGKYTILFFFEPDCSHCQHEAPIMKEVYNRIKDKGVSFLAFCTQLDTAKIYKFNKERNLSWQTVYSPYYGKYRDDYNIYSTPTVYLLDKDKKIIAKRIDAEQLEKIIVTEMLWENIKDLKGTQRIDAIKAYTKTYHFKKSIELIKEAVDNIKLEDAEKKDMDDFMAKELAKYKE